MTKRLGSTQKHVEGANTWQSSSYLSKQTHPRFKNGRYFFFGGGLWKLYKKLLLKCWACFSLNYHHLPLCETSLLGRVFYNNFLHVYVVVHVRMCIHVYMCGHMCVGVYASVWRPKVDVKHLPPLLFNLFTGLGSPAASRASTSAGPISQLASGSCLCLPSAGFTDARHTCPALTWVLGSRTRILMLARETFNLIISSLSQPFLTKSF